MSDYLTHGQNQFVPMNTEIAEAVTECLRERPSARRGVEINEKTNLLYDLGIDSMEGIEITCELITRLDVDIPLNENLLVTKEENGCRRMRTIPEIVSRLTELKTLCPQPQ